MNMLLKNISEKVNFMFIVVKLGLFLFLLCLVSYSCLLYSHTTRILIFFLAITNRVRLHVSMLLNTNFLLILY